MSLHNIKNNVMSFTLHQTCSASHKVKSSQSHDFEFFQNPKHSNSFVFVTGPLRYRYTTVTVTRTNHKLFLIPLPSKEHM
jgi:hypothetical protein